MKNQRQAQERDRKSRSQGDTEMALALDTQGTASSTKVLEALL